jgi:diguanylate cyclase (GGDEF)-like protein
MSDIKVTSEVNQQFLRRTPVKLRQFSRLLNDMLVEKIDPLRVKALLSQVNKTRESCAAQGFDSTAKLLNQLFKQLSLSDESLDTQKPLLKRLARKIQEHSEKLELGSRPQKAVPAEKKQTVEPKIPDDDPDTQKPVEADTNDQAEEQLAQIEVTDEIIEEEIDEDDSIDHSLEEQGIYLDKGVIIFVSQIGERYQVMSKQFESLGLEVHHTDELAKARQHAIDNPGSIIVSPLKYAEKNEQLADDEIETNRIPLIFTAEEDNQEDRLLALRNGGTGYLVEPVSISGLLELIERQYDLHADSPYRVLVMEDSKAQAKFYEKALSRGHFEVRLVSNPAVFMEALRGFDPEIVLMDMQMPGCSGIELTRVIRQMPRYAFLPIIFLSAEESMRKQNQALLSGGTSFIVKPAKKEQLLFLVELYSRRYRGLNPQIDINPDTGLTFCPQFKQKIAIEASRMSRNNCNAALAIIQLDEIDSLVANTNFSLINVAIQQLALILKQRLRKTDIVGHLEAGQLGVVLTTGKRQDWSKILDEIRLHFAELPFHLQHQDKELTISIGVATLSTNADAHNWYERASAQLHQAIEEGGDQTKPSGDLND